MPSSLPFELKDPLLLRQQSYVNNEWIEASTGARFDITDPGTGKVWASCPANDASDVDVAVESSHAAFQIYRTVNPRTRAKLLLAWHDAIVAARDDLAKIITYETGKPLAEAQAELDYAIPFTWWFMGEAERVRGTVAVPAAPNRRVFTTKQPIGVSVALVPWNFPVAMILRKASAALAAGCTMIVKPSPETPLTMLALAELSSRAGFEKGVLNVLPTNIENTPALSERLCKHPLVKKVTFTGSTAIGKLIARHCAEGLKKVTMELGGNCPFVIFDDADLQQALEALMTLKWRHAGQACITANRVYVQAGVFDDFQRLVVEATRKITVGHGAEAGTTMGPVTTPRGVTKVEEQVRDALNLGAELLLGGKRPDGLTGYFHEPTILSEMTPDMLVSREETFGPLLALYKFQTEAEAVAAANNTSMGLASYFFTKDVDRSWRLVENLEAGMIGMNTGNQSAAESPFGGIKESGYGKESGKDVAIDEYLITKTATMTLQGQY